jgi:hypothetical protein
MSETTPNLSIGKSARALSYVPVPPSRRLARLLRRAFAIAAAGIAILLTWQFSAAWRPQLVYAYYQSQCLQHVRPPSTLAYDDNPSTAGALRAADPQYKVPGQPRFDTPDDRPPPAYSPPSLYVPIVWERLGDPSPSRDVVAIPFLHERAAEPLTRLVCVKAGPAGWGPGGHSVVFTARTYCPAQLKPGARITPSSPAWVLIVRLAKSQHLRVYAGQADSTNPDHFTVEFEIDGQRGMIDGWLRGEQWAAAQGPQWAGREGVELRVRDGPGNWSENFVKRSNETSSADRLP